MVTESVRTTPIKYPILLASSALVLIIFSLILIYKIKALYGLAYTSDLINCTVSTKNFWLGRPWYYENARGAESLIHNYFIFPFLALFTFPYGSIGLWVLHTGLYVVAGLYFIYHLRTKNLRVQILSIILLGSVLCGPITFWLIDFRTYGFAPELLYAPLLLCFAIATIHRSKLRFFIMALVCITREEGPVLICSSALLLEYFIERNKSGLPLFANLFRYVKIIAPLLIIFALGMYYLRVSSTHANSRLSDALQESLKPMYWQLFDGNMLKQIASASLLFLAGILPLVLTARYLILPLVFISLPLTIIGLVGSASYLPVNEIAYTHGLTWEPKFVALWSLVTCAVYCSIEKADFNQKYFSVLAVLLAVVSFGLQTHTLKITRDYNLIERVSLGDLPVSKLYDSEINWLTCLKDAFPRNTPISVHGGLAGFFHKYDLSFADTAKNSWNVPEAIICDTTGRLPFEYGCTEKLKNDWLPINPVTETRGGITVAVKESLAGVLKHCQ